MATFAQLKQKIALMSSSVQQAVPSIVAETAVEYFKQSFSVKGWDGLPWPTAKTPPPGGTLMVRSAALVGSIRPKQVSAEQVIIAAGSPRVPYAKIHNQGGTIKQIPTPKQRRFFWAMARRGNPQQQDNTTAQVGPWGRMAMARELNIVIPQRKFAGHSPRLNNLILQRIQPLLKFK